MLTESSLSFERLLQKCFEVHHRHHHDSEQCFESDCIKAVDILSKAAETLGFAF